MGRKGSWFSAIKRVFVPSSKEKSTDGLDKKTTKERKGRGLLRSLESKSFIPLFREPSSIEKILGELDEDRFLGLPRVSTPRTSFHEVSPPKDASPRIIHNKKEDSHRPEPTSRDLQISATKIQTAYRGYMARRSLRALRGLARLQGVVKGHNVKRQTVNAMKQMQLLVRVQTQIHSRRTRMLENQASQRQAYKNEREKESTLSKSTYNQLVSGSNKEWDGSVLAKETREEKLRKRVEAVIKRERAMSYAYSHQVWKPQPKSAKSSPGGFLWWWNWFEGQTPTENIHLTSPRPISEKKLSPFLQSSNMDNNHEQHTPRSTKSSSMTIKGKHFLQTPSRTPPSNSSSIKNYPGPKASATNSRFDVDSLRSCPPFSVPNYMQPTISAKAKVRQPNSNQKERVAGSPGNDWKRRFSFPLTPNIGSFKWNRGSNKDSSSQKHRSVQSNDDRRSMGSAVSMPAVVGRKPFHRFV